MDESVKLQDIYDDIVYNELIDASCVLEQIKSAAISANYYINNAEPLTKKILLPVSFLICLAS